MNRIKVIFRNGYMLFCVEDYAPIYGLTWKDIKEDLKLDENDNPLLINDPFFENWDKYFYSEKISGYHGERINHYLRYTYLALIVYTLTKERKEEW